jgi:hypothetical protein
VPVHPRIPDFDVFEALGVTRDATPEAIKAAYRHRVKEHHPDAVGGSDEAIKRINVAYDWLRDPTLRRTYILATGRAGTLTPPWSRDPAGGLDRDEPPPPDVTYEGPRADRIVGLVDRLGSVDMAELVDLVHGYRPDVRWSHALARALEASGRRDLGAAAVWQVRRAVRDRVEALLESDAIRAAYDDELVGQAVSDRLADLARGIVLLDVLTPGARRRVATEWGAVMGPRSDPPGDGPGLAVRSGPLSALGASWSRMPDALRPIAVMLAAGLYATAANALLPSTAALVVILIGFAFVATVIAARRPPGARG